METVSILIPVFNSEKTIAQLCKVLIEELVTKTELEILLVNDGSRDSSKEACKILQNIYPEIVTYVELARNFGEHNALMAGLKYVTGDYCLMMDDDFQNSPKDAWKLIEEIRKGYDVVYSYSSSKEDPFLRNVGSWINDKMANFIIKKPTDIYLSSYKIVNRFIINEIAKYDGTRPYIDGIIFRSTDRVGKVQVEHYPRRYGQSGYTVRKLLSLWGNMVLNFSMIPLRIIGTLGLVLCITSLIYFVYKFFLDETIGFLTDHEVVMTTLMLVFGLVFLSIALMAEYIGMIHLHLYNDPQFIVREILPRCKKRSDAGLSSLTVSIDACSYQDAGTDLNPN